MNMQKWIVYSLFAIGLGGCGQKATQTNVALDFNPKLTAESARSALVAVVRAGSNGSPEVLYHSAFQDSSKLDISTEVPDSDAVVVILLYSVDLENVTPLIGDGDSDSVSPVPVQIFQSSARKGPFREIDRISDDTEQTLPEKFALMVHVPSSAVPEDEDGDGFAVEDDCNDLNASIYPNAPEVNDSRDNDCNDLIDENNRGPEVTLQINPAMGEAPLDITLTYQIEDADDDEVSCTLDLGDGTEENVAQDATQGVHTYPIVGDYVVTLTCADSFGGSTEETQAITVLQPNNPPVINQLQVSPLSGNAPLDVIFTLRASDPDNHTVTCTLTPGTALTPLTLTFASATSYVAQTRSYRYTGIGSFTPTFSCSDGAGGTVSMNGSTVTTNNAPPVLTSFQVTPTSGPAPLTVTFTLQVSDPNNQTVNCTINPGNGSANILLSFTSPYSILSASRIYNGISSYTPSVSCADVPYGAVVSANGSMVTTSNAPPLIAQFSANPSMGSDPLTVQFTVSASDSNGHTLSCTLDPSDGSTPYTLTIPSPYTTRTQSHIYTNIAGYTATLSCNDGAGGNVSAPNVSITVVDYVIVTLDNSASATNWVLRSNAQAFGGNFLESNAVGTEYTFSTSSLAPGDYLIQGWWPASAGNGSAVRHQITHQDSDGIPATTLSDLFVNQRVNGGQWNNLMAVHLSSAAGSVKITSPDIAPPTGGKAAADAIRFTELPFSNNCSELAKTGWSIRFFDSQETQSEPTPATNAIDGNVNTIWGTQWFAADPVHPHEIQIDLGASRELCAFNYIPRPAAPGSCNATTTLGVNGTVATYEFYVSNDPNNWGAPVVSGSLIPTQTDLCGDRSARTIIFPSSRQGQFVRFRSLREINNNPWTTAAEIGVRAVGAP